ncbi:hypothetical protein ACRYWZ_18275 (plasmid) [Agrobacterium deltaense]
MDDIPMLRQPAISFIIKAVRADRAIRVSGYKSSPNLTAFIGITHF